MSDQALSRVLGHARQGGDLREKFFAEYGQAVVDVARLMAVSLARGGKLLFCGNGGSAADAQHLAAEFVNRFELERPPLPALALTTDTSILTAVGNDYGFEQVFQKQVQALGHKGDVLVAISTSGNSENVVLALRAAREKEMVTIGLTGQGGGEMAQMCDCLLAVPHKRTCLVQEIHITVGHMVCDLVDYFLFEAVHELTPYLDPAAEV
ncbi:Phosphoheptose isomerase [Alkalidesulfovibrio alkalitolerans DSM 16529]|jgi:D-sedoheptulose 7-phosphate isomerase|uniref:Phosphoheptose isomerase n=1 Tax=Alkalidesulfovibrio alkalitolerans DSM 16529 TaxID=1121439 RepID=S7TER5_9BACT|nr:D-sedoheptulose 7-phosphate isomerase [Alkalidesulfovibrio alkalitolerans]EPR35677.1 Phosphoheptose isomerase [Alkalidesulfovibrio alkalitolerans DSM 16529]